MKQHFHLKALDEVNIWTDESPIETYLSQQLMNTEIGITSYALVSPRHNQLVIELKQPRGPRCLYGLLGVKVEAPTGNSLRITIGDGQADSRLFDGSMLAKIETPRYGLPEDAAKAILASLQNEIALRGIAVNSDLKICFGAFGDISSNILMFNKIAKTIIRLLVDGIQGEDQLIQLLL